MFFQKLLVTLYQQLNGERSAMAPYYVLKGKKSGQTLQDIHYYKLTGYFAIAPDLSKEDFQAEVNSLVSQGWLHSFESPTVTDEGRRFVTQFNTLFATNTMQPALLPFEKKILLLSQFASNALYHEKSYVPVVTDIEIQTNVKRWINECSSLSDAANLVKESIQNFIQEEQLTESQKTLFIFRLTGYHLAGLTWTQLAFTLNSRPIDCLFEHREVIAKFIDYLKRTKHPLHRLVKVPSPLTETASLTKNYLEKGYSLDQIVAVRNLKQSTIEDHYIEIATLDPDFEFHKILSGENVQTIMRTRHSLNTYKLKLLRDQLPEFSYFQIRLALALGERHS